MRRSTGASGGGEAVGVEAPGGAAVVVDLDCTDLVLFLMVGIWMSDTLFVETRKPVRGEVPRLSAPQPDKRDPPDFRPTFVSIGRIM